MNKATTRRRIQRKNKEQRQQEALDVFFATRPPDYYPVKTGLIIYKKGYLKRTDGKVTIVANCGTPIREKNRGISWISSS